MGTERQRAMVRHLLDLAARETTQLADAALELPATAYVAPDVWAAERDAVFRRRPVVACLSGDVAEPGSYHASESGGIPILVVRQPDSTIAAFANICRHRGSPLVGPGRGHVARTFRCGFHGWVYDHAGRVVGRPHSAGGFDAVADRCAQLVELPVAEAHGLVVVRPEGSEPVAVGELLAGMADELDDVGIARYRPLSEWTSEWAANWKLLVDTFLETYHVPALHADTVARYYLATPSAWAPFGPNLRFHSLQKGFLTLRERPETEWDLVAHSTLEYLVAPATIFSNSVDHLGVYQFSPVAPDRTRVVFTMYVDHEIGDDERAHYERTMQLHQRVSGGEDFPQQEATHRALASGALPQVVIGRNEPAVIHFHRALHLLLGAR